MGSDSPRAGLPTKPAQVMADVAQRIIRGPPRKGIRRVDLPESPPDDGEREPPSAGLQEHTIRPSIERGSTHVFPCSRCFWSPSMSFPPPTKPVSPVGREDNSGRSAKGSPRQFIRRESASVGDLDSPLALNQCHRRTSTSWRSCDSGCKAPTVTKAPVRTRLKRLALWIGYRQTPTARSFFEAAPMTDFMRRPRRRLGNGERSRLRSPCRGSVSATNRRSGPTPIGAI